MQEWKIKWPGLKSDFLGNVIDLVICGHEFKNLSMVVNFPLSLFSCIGAGGEQIRGLDLIRIVILPNRMK